MIAGAGFAVAGAAVVGARPITGHLLLAAGTLLFALGGRILREPVATPAGDVSWGGSRLPLLGFAFFALALAIRMIDFGNAAVLGLWLGGLAITVAGALASHFRDARTRAAGNTLAALVVLLTAAAVNLVRLGDFPWAVHGDVGEIALQALAMDVARDTFSPTPAWWGIPGMHHAIQRLGLAVDGGLVGARLPDAVIGVVAALTLYATVREMAGRRAAVVAALLGVGSASMINTYRLGVAVGPPVLLMLAALWAFFRGVTAAERPRDFFLLAGVLAGIAVQVYLPARVVPLALGAFATHEIVLGTSAGRSRAVRGFLWTVAAAVVVAGPLLYYYALHSDSLMPLSDKSLLSARGLEHSRQMVHTQSLLDVLWRQSVLSLGMFHYYPNGADLGFFLSYDGFFEPLTAALLWLGLGAALARFSERRFAWPALGFLVALMLQILTVDPPSYHRAGPVAAMALVLVGIACGSLLDAVERTGKRRADALAALIAGAGLLWGTTLYFGDHCRREWKLSDSTAVARRVAVEPAEGSFTYLMAAPWFDFGYGNIRFLARGHRGTDLRPGAPPPRELTPGVNLFIALPDRAAELRALARQLPPGHWEEYYKASPANELEILVLRIEVPTPRDGE